MNDSPVRVEDFLKRYGKFVAVDGISFEAHRGEIFGLLGPNGAGKTSTLETLEGLRSADGGVLRIMGVDPTHEAHKLRDLIGVQLQTSGLPGSMTVREAMEFFCAYHRVAPRPDLLQRLGLSEKVSTQYYALSTGQKRRLALALAIAHNPPVVLLDEPTAGLDVGTRTELHGMMREMKDAGTTILLATHDMAEAEKMADRVAILLRGKVVATGTPRELTATGSGFTKISVRTEGGSLSSADVAFPGVSRQTTQDEYAVYFTTSVGPTLSAILARIESHGVALVDLRVERPSLEERFLEITSAGGAQ